MNPKSIGKEKSNNMKPRKLLHRFAVASWLSVAAVTVALVGVVGVGSVETAGPAAAAPSAPTFPTACVSSGNLAAITGITSNGGSLAAITGITSTASNFTITLGNTNGLSPGQKITLTGFTPAAYNATWTIGSLTANTIVVSSTLNPGTTTVNGAGTNTASFTITLANTNGLAAGDAFTLAGFTPAAYNSTWAITYVTPTTIGVLGGTNPGTTTVNGTGTSPALGQTTIAPGTNQPPQQFGTYPNWLPCNQSASNVDESQGSDTTLFMMQSISDLYNGSGINPFSCTQTSTNVANCTAAAGDATQGDLFDNFAGTEELTGTDWVGSGNGLNLLCGTNSPPRPVDYSRSSKAPGDGSSCSGGGTIQAIGFAKDSVVPIDFQTIVPEAYMQAGDEAPGYIGQTFISYCQTLTTPGCNTATALAAISGITSTATNFTITLANTNNLAAGDSITLTGFTPAAYNATFTIGSITGTTIVVSSALNPGPTTVNGTGTSTPGVGGTLFTEFPSSGVNRTGIGPVADGWLPGDPYNCGSGGGPACSGTAFSDMDNTQDPSSTNGGATSVAYRLFCQHGPSTTPYESQIMDWGNLTNLSPAANGGTAAQPGDGAPIGVPIRVISVNTGSGTTSTFYTFTQSGILGGANCTGNSAGNPVGSSGGVDTNAAQGQNPQNPQGGRNAVGNTETAVENDANQIGDFASANWAGVAPAGAGNADAADQAIDIATSLYFESLGVYNTNPNAQVTSIEIPNGDAAGGLNGQPGTFLATQMSANGISATTQNELQNGNPMARTLFNVLNTASLRASTGGFINWMCDANSAFQKGRNVLSGGNYNTDLTNLILGQYGFQRLSDVTSELSVTLTNALADGIAGNNNGYCQARLKISSTGGVGTNTVTLAATAPPTVQVGWPVAIQIGSVVRLPAAGANGANVILSISGTAVTIGDITPTVGGVLQPAISTTVAAGSNGGTLANIASWSTPGNGDLAVANATSFPAGGGVAEVATSGGNAFVSFTGTDATDLLGVTFLSQSNPGSTSTVSTGGAVTLVQAQNFVAGTGGGPTPAQLYLPGHPPVLSVTTPNT